MPGQIKRREGVTAKGVHSLRKGGVHACKNVEKQARLLLCSVSGLAHVDRPRGHGCCLVRRLLLACKRPPVAWALRELSCLTRLLPELCAGSMSRKWALRRVQRLPAPRWELSMLCLPPHQCVDPVAGSSEDETCGAEGWSAGLERAGA